MNWKRIPLRIQRCSVMSAGGGASHVYGPEKKQAKGLLAMHHQMIQMHAGWEVSDPACTMEDQ